LIGIIRIFFYFNLAHNIRLETEQEEKRLLQEQLRQLENSSNEANNKLSKQIDQVEDIFSININQYLLLRSS
jgi:hypothetical protein